MNIFFKLPLIIFVLTKFLICHACADDLPGITIKQFRIFYNESEKKGVTWSLTNNTERAYLIQSWIRPLDAATGMPIVNSSMHKFPLLVTPPLKRVNPGEYLSIRIRLTEASLPIDRESVFYLSVKGIPSLPDKALQTGDQIAVAFVNNIKLFYRPESIPQGGISKCLSQVRLSREGEELKVINPTPFYLQFGQLKVGGKKIAAEDMRKLVPPKGEQRFLLPEGASGLVEWQVINENNELTALQRHSL
ncbi:TPA: molecular chaperone [Enterobacter cloacae subsp. cloacae]|nr:molecular chaperone [Enterobacter cloacae subsp. cloacae]HCM9271121.1 molecular chaperone [Enterobacter cloacae subsp. cloacae]HCM9540478.1 molecular chaperone [Enterobacter cloacae subsp. cloacae]HCM9542745.1 molecular chaperone [Enterobacter cloacae subsp. cloacae]HDC4406308.1 molecular chaperone [Enterobacter cloacae]